jgi:hypothetical protein
VLVGPEGGKLTSVASPDQEPDLQQTEQGINAALSNS